ncbi:MAG: hypothetical protein ACK5RO_09720 [Pseudobdellovibrionaceae bacterium]
MQVGQVLNPWYQHKSSEDINPWDIAFVKFSQKLRTPEFELSFEPFSWNNKPVGYIGYGTQYNPFTDIRVFLDSWPEFKKIMAIP